MHRNKPPLRASSLKNGSQLLKHSTSVLYAYTESSKDATPPQRCKPTSRSGSPVRSKELTKRPKHNVMSQMNLFPPDNASPLHVAPSSDQQDDTSGDAVVAEMEKWPALPSSTVDPFCVDGLVDEFALVSSLNDFTTL